jgi:hypothetical protein
MITLKGRGVVDKGSLVVEGARFSDYPDFCDAYFADGTFTDGRSLTDEDLYELTMNEGELLYEMAMREAVG